MNKKDILAISQYKELLDNIFQVAPYLASITLDSVGSQYTPNYEATSPMFDHKYIPLLKFNLVAFSMDELTLPALKHLKTMWAADHPSNANDFNENSIKKLLKSRSKQILQLLDIAAKESGIITVKNNNSFDSEYIFTSKDIKLQLLKQTFAPTPVEINCSKQFRKALSKL